MAAVAINGLGRIGRATPKVLHDLADVDDADTPDGIRVAAVNDLVPIDNLAYLLRYDAVYGRYPRPVTINGDALMSDGHRVPVYSNDNEWGYTPQMVREALAILGVQATVGGEPR